MKRALLGLFLGCLSLGAVPITYVYEGIGSGDLGDNGFVDASFIVTALADTDNITTWAGGGDVLQNTHLSASIFISGLGTFNITDATQTWLGGSGGGLGRDLGSNLITLSGTGFTQSLYGLDTNFGPLTDLAPANVSQFTNLATSGGVLSFGGGSSISTVTFTAIVDSEVPEPSTFVLLSLGLAGLGLKRFRSTR